MVTAEALYDGEIVQTSLLREAEIAQFRTGRLLLPVWRLWRWVLRAAWMTGHSSQRVPRDDFRRRVQAVADLAESAETDVLLVSHAGMMVYLRRELLRRGFCGPRFRIAENGRLYVREGCWLTLAEPSALRGPMSRSGACGCAGKRDREGAPLLLMRSQVR